MAKREKRVKNLLEDWLEADQPTHSRKANLLGAHQKDAKIVFKQYLPRVPNSQPARQDELIVREPSGPIRVRIKQSPAHSWEHQQRLERQPQLRAPFRAKPAQPAVRHPQPAKFVAARVRAVRSGARRTG